MTDPDQAAYRAQINEELGFYPAKFDEESVAGYRRQDGECRRLESVPDHPQ